MARKKNKSQKNEIKDGLTIKVSPNGCRLTGPYNREIPGEILEKLMTRSSTVTLEKEYLQYLVEGSYTIVEEEQITKEPVSEPVPKEEPLILKNEDEQ